MKAEIEKNNYPLLTVNSPLKKSWQIKKLGEVCLIDNG